MAALINPAITHVIRSGIANLSKNRELGGVALKHECAIAEFVSTVRNGSKKIIGTSNKLARYSCARLQPRAQWTEGGNLASAVGNTSVTSSSRHHDHDAAKLLCIEEDVELVHGAPRCRISVLSAVSKSADPMLIIDAVGAVLGDQVQEGFMASLSESLDLNEARPQPIPVGGFNSGVREQLSGVDMVTAEVQVMAPPMYHPKLVWFAKSEEEENRYLDRAINATLAGAALSFAFTKLVTVDHDYWHGWTIMEILKYAPLHNWNAYEEVLKSNPVIAKMMISGVVYSIGDWIGQFLFPFKGWWVVPLKVLFDQTIWSAIWNSIYYVVLGLLRFESPARIWKDLKATFFPLLSAGWKLWPFAHLVTYGLVPVEQRLLWVDCVEIVWVTILSMFANKKAEQRLEAVQEASVATDLLLLSEGDDMVASKES
ncbi:hypothetical protein BDL97_02G048900 [Sphagnum fallax]|nr:hypothetical protein BDL97_02G048900 [Sphagnum fallax]